MCSNCGTTTTTLWRRNNEGTYTYSIHIYFTPPQPLTPSSVLQVFRLLSSMYYSFLYSFLPRASFSTGILPFTVFISSSTSLVLPPPCLRLKRCLLYILQYFTLPSQTITDGGSFILSLPYKSSFRNSYVLHHPLQYFTFVCITIMMFHS